MLIQHPVGMFRNAISQCFDQDKIYVVSLLQNIFPLRQDRCAVLQDILIQKYPSISHSAPPNVKILIIRAVWTLATVHRKVAQNILSQKERWESMIRVSYGQQPPCNGYDSATHHASRALIKGVLTYLRFHALATLPNHVIPYFTTQHLTKPYHTIL